VAVLPGLLVAHSAYTGLVTRKLTQPVVQRRIVMAHLAGRPPGPAVLAFSGLLRDAFRTL
jgi:DNA-binding transcriptional LysR family regulator